jgi:uncharacterized protein YkwD
MAVAGCGGTGATTDSNALRLSAEPPAGPRAVERTGGRLGDATAIRAGESLRALSLGGRPDVRRHDKAPRRDGIGAGAACANPTLAPAPASIAAINTATLCLLNGERADHGLAPLAANARLAAAATAYAQDLVAGSYFSHTGRNGSTVYDRVNAAGYIPPGAGWALGENLAWGTGALSTPGSIMQAWMNSPGHRENILNPDFREIGVGIALGNPAQTDGQGATYATEFAVLDGVDDAAEPPAPSATPDESTSPSPRKAHKRKRARKRRHARARSARHARLGKGRGLGHNRRKRGPKAHIAI